MSHQQFSENGSWTTPDYLLVIGSLALVGMAAIVALVGPARGYEFSIYDAYPVVFWVLAGVGLLVGQALLLRRAFGTADGRWRYGLAIVVGIEVLILLLPYLRGYPVFNRSDVLTHVGYIRDIQRTNGLGGRNIYPNIHMLVLTLAYATGVKPMQVINSIPVVVTAFSVVATYALVTSVFDHRRALATLPFAVIFLGGTAHTNPSPYAQTVLIVPFVLYLFVRGQQLGSTPVRAALAIVLVSLVIYHPLTTLFLLAVFAIYTVSRVARGNSPISTDPSEQLGRSVGSTVAQLMAGVFVAWYSNFASVIGRFSTAYERLFAASGGGESRFEAYGSTVNRFSPALIDLLTIGAVKYGQSGLFIGLGGIYVAKSGIESLLGRARMGVYELTFTASFLVFTGLGAVFLFVDLFVGFGRLLVFARIFAALLVGTVTFELYHRYGARRLVVGATALACVVVVIIGLVGVYHSPLETRQNQQVTEAELEGSAWLLEYRSTSVGIDERGINMWRFRDALYGTEGYGDRQVVAASGNSPPPHFGYDTNATLGASYDSDRYLVLTELGREYYPNMYPDYREFWSFESADYQRLERDGTVSHLYDNGEVDVYYVNGTE